MELSAKVMPSEFIHTTLYISVPTFNTSVIKHIYNFNLKLKSISLGWVPKGKVTLLGNTEWLTELTIF
jgi:hypothetical protein